MVNTCTACQYDPFYVCQVYQFRKQIPTRFCCELCLFDQLVDFAKLAPTLFSVFTSRLSRQRPHSPQPPGAQMGQQASKKSKKGSKDKDKESSPEDLVSAQETATDGRPQNVGLGAADMDGSDSALHEPNPLISVSDPTGAPIPASGNSSRTHGSPYPLNAAILPDQPPLSAPSQISRSPSPKPHTSAPLDIPSQPILSNGGSFNPSSVNSIGNDAAESLGSNVAKDKLKSLDIDDMIQRLLDVGYTGKVSKSLCLKNSEITAICMAARDIFLNQPTLIELSPPVKIVGDVHGQYSDLIRLFEMCGFPPTANYLFLGDYVDRGKQSLETILLLLCYKIKYPENFFLLRGNHECANVTRGSYILPTFATASN